MHIGISKHIIIIGADNGLSPGRHQAITLTNAEIWIFVDLTIRNKFQ